MQFQFGYVGAALSDCSTDHAKVTRWMATTLDWGVLSTVSTRKEGTAVGDAFGNPYSFADAGTGVPYFFGSTLDASMVDAFVGDAAQASPRASFVLSEAQLSGDDELSNCKIGSILGDPEKRLRRVPRLFFLRAPRPDAPRAS